MRSGTTPFNPLIICFPPLLMLFPRIMDIASVQPVFFDHFLTEWWNTGINNCLKRPHICSNHSEISCCAELLSHVQLFATPWTVALQVPLSMGFSRQEYWSGLPCPSLGDLPNPGIEPQSPTLQVDSLPSEPPGKPKNTGVGSLSLLQGIFPTQKLNRGSPALQADSLPAELHWETE